MSEEKQSDVVTVNHENLDDFNSKQLGLPTAEEHAAAEEAEIIEAEAQADEKPAEEVKAEEAEPKEEKPKKKNSFQERISELTAKEKAVQAQLDAEKAEKEALKRELDAIKNQPKPVEESPEPTRDKFQSEDEYIEAKAEWKSEQKLREKEARNLWQKRVDEAKAEFPDYDEVMAKNGDMELPNAVLDAIKRSKIGPKIARQIAADAEIANTLKGLPIIEQIMEIGKIEASLTKPKEAPKADTKPEIQVSKAPAPVTPIKGATTYENKLDADGVFHGTPEEWAAARRAGKIK